MIKCGSVVFLGKTNAGKSTLTNAMVGQKVSIVSDKPNTTRDSIIGIKNGKDQLGNAYQIVYYDTPGMYSARNQLNKIMGKQISGAVASVDIVCYVMDDVTDDQIEIIKNYSDSGKPVIVVVSKLDLYNFEKLYPKLNKLNSLDFVKSVVCCSAVKKTNLDFLEKEIVKYLPERQPMFEDKSLYTTQSFRFLVAETVREVALNNLRSEIPHGVGVYVAKFEEGPKQINIMVDIICERQSHKNIIIGKGGKMIKIIGSEARAQLIKTASKGINLELFVKVEKDWRNKPGVLDMLGYKK